MVITWILLAAAAGMLSVALGSFASAYVANASLTSVNVWLGYTQLGAAIGLASMALWCYRISSIKFRAEASAQDLLEDQ